MLERLGAGDAAALGDVPHDHDRGAGVLGEAHQPGGALADLADVAGRAFEQIGVDRLDRIENQDLGAHRGGGFENRLEAGLAGHVHRAGVLLEAVGPEADLLGGLLAAGIEHPAAARLEPGRRLEQQGGLADARLATDQDHRAGHHPAAQHEVELVEARWTSG